MVYLDAAATTPVRREALEAMWPHLTGRFGNPSSVHALGHDAAGALDTARRAVAGVLGARAAEVTFTSGGTEGDNAAVKGLALARRAAVGATRVVVSAVEHDAVLASAHWLATLGFEVVELVVDGDGFVDPGEVAAVLADGGAGVALVSLQLANNEVGTVQPVAEVAALTRAAGVPLHTDAVQAAGWLPLAVGGLGVDALTLSGHKVGAPPGTGALWVRRGVRLEPLVHGGGQERGRRSGTENVPGAVGFAVALGLAEAERVAAVASSGDGVDPVARERDAFVAAVRGGVGPLLPAGRGLRLTGHPTRRLPGHASFVLGGVSGESVLLELEERGVLSSSGSACHAGSDEPSHVLTAMGLDRETAQTALRFSWSRSTTAAELATAATALTDAVGSLTR
ncbi:cysteine desulfurase family protein [Litorihabitans aurantiacus]|uniref:cysteine desulfurase n=1 Tax=Litorihabitans aurantiacus TaxID=1930061 RepID=A0AA37XFU6_9MICO|nr:cysteine desulfurase family protein [Litorihabitans aurantiacus]GMA32015.1 cysteine desulfurase [Litorihabitans aurantiacus]